MMKEKTLLSTMKIQFTKAMFLMAFTVIGLTASAQVWVETFDNTTLPAGWANYPSGGGSTSSNAYWKFSGNLGYGMSGTQDHTGNGGSFTWVDGSSPYGQAAHLATDSIPIATFTNPALVFWMKRNNTNTATRQVLHIDVWNGSAWVYDQLVQQANTVNGDWERFQVNLDTITIASQTSIRFRLDKLSSNFYDDVAIDDIEIISVFSDDAGAVAVTSPTLPACTLDSVVTAEIKNFGADTLFTATVNWTINGTLQTPYLWADTLEPGATAMVTISTNAALAFGDTIEVATAMPNGVVDLNTVNDSVTFNYIAGLSGVKTIDPSGAGDFISFNDAVNSMAVYGVCGNLVFEAVNGSYVEQLDLQTYDGMDYMNTVTFRSQSGNADSVSLQFSGTSSSDNWVVKMFDADYFSFADMTFENIGATYSTTMYMWAADSISFDNCKFISNGTTSNAYNIRAYYYNSGTYAACNDLTIINSEIIGGYYGLYLSNTSSAQANNAVIENNKFLNNTNRAGYITYVTDLQFNGNYINSNSTYAYGYGVYFASVNKGSVSNNHIEGTSTWPRTGIYFSSVSGDLSNYLRVVNNRVYIPAGNSQYGLYVYNNLFVEFAFNSIYKNVVGSGTNRGVYFYNGGYNKFNNNNVQVVQGDTALSGTAIYLNGNSLFQSDYNNLSAGNAGNFSGTWYGSVTDWTAATGFDTNSLKVEMVYSDTATLKVCTDSLYGVGMSIASYSVDFEGDLRQNPPCIGADEFMPISEFGFSNNPVLCTGDTLTLRQDYYDTVVWNGNDTSNVFTVTNAGQVTVAVYDGCGTANDTFNVDPQQVSSLADTNLCEGTTATLSTGISNGTYLWSNGSTDSTATVDSAQTISVQIVDAYGCNSTAISIVTQSYDVVLNNVDSFCQGGNVVLDANMTGSYTWNDGSANQTLSVNTAGSYSVTVVDQNCTSSDTTMVYEILNTIPSFTDSSSYLTVVFTNTTQNATSYLWDFGDGTTSTDVNPTHVYPWTPDSVLLYTATLTAYNSCGDNEFVNDGVRVGQLVSVSEIDLASMINVYPNPNNGVFNVVVKTDDAAELSIQVLDVRGSLVYSNSFGTVNGEVNRTINLESAAQGIYFVKVTLNGETAVYRLSVN